MEVSKNMDWKQCSKEKDKIVFERYRKFTENADNMKEDPIKVFFPLNAKQLEELQLIRELSRELQEKKDEYIINTAQIHETKTTGEPKEKITKEEALV